MPKEIERKFLVTGDFMSSCVSAELITQGYLVTTPDCTVRVRAIQDNHAAITIKGKSDAAGLSRDEWEYPIPYSHAVDLLALPGVKKLSKIRHMVPVGQHVYEVDVFLGNLRGLVIAEVELSSEADTPIIPDWVGEEVTGNLKYYNSQLLK